MHGWILCGILVILLIILYFRYRTKQELDRTELIQLEAQIESLKQQRDLLNNNINTLQQQTDIAMDRYNNAQRDKTNELENYIELQKRRRMEIMDQDMSSRESLLKKTFEALKEMYENLIQDELRSCEKSMSDLKEAYAIAVEELNKELELYLHATDEERKRFESLRKPLLQYEMERLQRLYYTILLPEEYLQDIEFLLTTVSAKVLHPDIINKLVWAEYVKPNLDETFKRIEIKDEPGIYKLTNIENGKAYIGKSTNVKKRIQDHFKSAIGIESIADQKVHHEILQTGFWNWTIEVIIYCDKDKLSELEKYYIDFFKTQEYGYNRNAGG